MKQHLASLGFEWQVPVAQWVNLKACAMISLLVMAVGDLPRHVESRLHFQCPQLLLLELLYPGCLHSQCLSAPLAMCGASVLEENLPMTAVVTAPPVLVRRDWDHSPALKGSAFNATVNLPSIWRLSDETVGIPFNLQYIFFQAVTVSGTCVLTGNPDRLDQIDAREPSSPQSLFNGDIDICEESVKPIPHHEKQTAQPFLCGYLL